MPFCPECGSKHDDDALFCGECGFKLGSQATPAQATPAQATPAQATPAATTTNQNTTKDDSVLTKDKEQADAGRLAEDQSSAGEAFGAGNYLTYDRDVSDGSLFMNWKEEELKEGCVHGYFKPSKPVPKFKFKSKGGKDELTRNIKGTEMKNYYQAVCNFVKTAYSFQSLIVFTDFSVGRVYFHLKGDKILKLEKGKFYDLSEIPELSVGVCPASSEPFQGVETMSRGDFLGKCAGSLNIKLPK